MAQLRTSQVSPHRRPAPSLIGVGLTIVAALLGCETKVDQAQLGSRGYLALSGAIDPIPAGSRGQTFTVGITGFLVGVELSAGFTGPTTVDRTLFLSVADRSAKITSASLPGQGVPGPLSIDSIGPGYFDLSALPLPVQAGEKLELIVTTNLAPPRCDSDSHVCVEGYVGQSCYFDFECLESFQVGSDWPNPYPAGGVTAGDGQESPYDDLAFKTFVQPSG